MYLRLIAICFCLLAIDVEAKGGGRGGGGRGSSGGRSSSGGGKFYINR